MKQSIFGIISLTIGILCIVFSCCGMLTTIVCIIGIVMGIAGIMDDNGSSGCAIAGLICSIVALAISLVAGWFLSGIASLNL